MLEFLCFTVLLWFSQANGANNSEVLKSMSVHYGRTLYSCLEELKLGQDVLTDFLYYWRSDYEIKNRQTGCAAICINKKLSLIDGAGLLSNTSADAFVKASGGDDNLASYLIYLYQSCQTVAKAAEECDKALEVNNCFRNAVQRAQWSPDVRVEVHAINDG